MANKYDGAAMKKVLIVEDDAACREMLREVLEAENLYEIYTANDGIEALRQVESVPFDLIVTDIVMPEQDGIGLIFELSRKYPDIKYIVISGGGRIKPEDYLNMADKLGAVRTFKKPFDIEEFAAAVHGLLA